jgi:23S rRNA (pseudouridine1915-N3)-methyltransferase
MPTLRDMKLTCHIPFRVGRESPILDAALDWESRIRRVRPFFEIQAPRKKTLSEAEVEAFYEQRLKDFSGAAVVALDEAGTELSSVEFAKMMIRLEEKGTKSLHFCLGGAYGLPKVLNRVQGLAPVSLSRLTFSHELAFVVLLEQIYRAQTIISGHPYHHAAQSGFIRERRQSLN